jgi:hypothetical protein
VSEQGTFQKSLDALCERERTLEKSKGTLQNSVRNKSAAGETFTKASEIF